MSNSHIEPVTEIIAEMRDAAVKRDMQRFDKRSDELIVFTRACIPPTEPETAWSNIVLTKTQRRVLNALNRRQGNMVTKSAIMDALYFDKPNGEAQQGIINVEVCYLRKKLNGSGYFIKNHHSEGYSLQVMGEAEAK